MPNPVGDQPHRGDTLLAAASRVSEAYPDAEVRAFAPVRTMELVADIVHIPEPTVRDLLLREYDGSQRVP